MYRYTLQGDPISQRVRRRVTQFVVAGLACALVLAWPSGIRAALYNWCYPVMGVDARALYAAPASLQPFGYLEDNPAELADLRAVADAAVLGAHSDIERLRRLGDLVLSWRRPGLPYMDGTRELGLREIVARLQRGEHGFCGHNVIAVSGLWRSLGRDFREVRFRTPDAASWGAGHYGIEAYLTDAEDWVYFDTELNGYAVDDAGEPLSLLELDTHLAQGEAVRVLASTRYRDISAEQLLFFVRTHPIQLYTMKNTLRAFDPDRRFGVLNGARPVLARLPSPLDRAVDTLTGDGAPRLAVVPAPPAPAPGAALRVSASPGG